MSDVVAYPVFMGVLFPVKGRTWTGIVIVYTWQQRQHQSNTNLHPSSDFDSKSHSHCSTSRDNTRLWTYISDFFSYMIAFTFILPYQLCYLHPTWSKTAIFRNIHHATSVAVNYPLLGDSHISLRSLILHQAQFRQFKICIQRWELKQRERERHESTNLFRDTSSSISLFLSVSLIFYCLFLCISISLGLSLTV